MLGSLAALLIVAVVLMVGLGLTLKPQYKRQLVDMFTIQSVKRPAAAHVHMVDMQVPDEAHAIAADLASAFPPAKVSYYNRQPLSDDAVMQKLRVDLAQAELAQAKAEIGQQPHVTVFVVVTYPDGRVRVRRCE